MTDFWKDRKVLVTGPTGLVGSWLVKALLAQDANVIVLIHDANPQSELYRSSDIQRVSVINGTLEDFGVLERAINQFEVDTIFHLGAQAIVGMANRFPLPTFETNIRGTYNLLEACRLHMDMVQRVVIATSDKIYGEQLSLPCTEETLPNGQFPYDVSKRCAELIAQTYHNTYTLPVAIIRCGNVYGGGDLNWSRIVPGTICSFLKGHRPTIRSDGTYVRDYIYVKDVTDGFMRLAELLEDKRVWGDAFNLSTEQPITVLEIVNVIRNLIGCEHLEPIVLNCVKGEIREQRLSVEKVRRLLKWKPVFDLESGLRETVDWYKAFYGVE